jgi:hypothetical protein
LKKISPLPKSKLLPLNVIGIPRNCIGLIVAEGKNKSRISRPLSAVWPYRVWPAEIF